MCVSCRQWRCSLLISLWVVTVYVTYRGQWRCSLLISLWVVKVYSTYRGQWRRILRIPLWAVKVYFVYTIVGGEGVFYLSWTVKLYFAYTIVDSDGVFHLLLTVTVYFTYHWQWRCILLIPLCSVGRVVLISLWTVKLYFAAYDILDTQGVFYYYEQSRCILLSHCGNECVFHWELSEGVLNYLIMGIKWKCILLISLWELGEGVFYLSHCGN